MPATTEPLLLGLAQIPGGYYDRIIEASWHQERGELEEAAAIYRRVVDRISALPERRRPPGSDLNLFLAAAATGLLIVRAAQGDFETAQALCAKLELWDPENAHRWRRRTHELRIDQGLVDEGLAGLQQLADREPDDFEIWYVMAYKAVDAERYDLAEPALARATVLAPHAEPGPNSANALAQVYVTWYDFYCQQRRWQEAGRAWDKALALDPDVGSMQEQVLRMFLDVGLWDDAQRYVSGDLAGPVGEYYEGYLAFRRGDKVRARHIWRKLVEADYGEDVRARRAQAKAWCYLGLPRRALELLLNDVRTSGEFGAPAALILALAWAMEGNAEAALADLGIAAKTLRDSGSAAFSQLDWYDFEELVQDEALKSQLRPAFEGGMRSEQ